MKNTLLWIAALLLTLGSAYYQRKTGPTHPLDGEHEVSGIEVRYSLTRSHGGEGDQEVAVTAPDGRIWGRLLYKRYKTADAWKGLPMRREGDRLVGFLPHQPPAGKLEYFIELHTSDYRVVIPRDGETVVTRFKGAVPDLALLPHIVFMFLGMLLAMRTGLEALLTDGRPRSYVLWTLGLIFVGGMILGPVVQKFAFGEYWTGFPFGTDLTDNKTLVIFAAWLVAAAAVWNPNALRSRPRRRWIILAASLLTLVIYMIPHSMMGSELDYSKLDAAEKAVDTLMRAR